MRDNRKKKNRKMHEPIREIKEAIQPYREGTTANPHLKEVIVEVVENQIRDFDPPETRQTFERLMTCNLCPLSLVMKYACVAHI